MSPSGTRDDNAMQVNGDKSGKDERSIWDEKQICWKVEIARGDNAESRLAHMARQGEALQDDEVR